MVDKLTGRAYYRRLRPILQKTIEEATAEKLVGSPCWIIPGSAVLGYTTCAVSCYSSLNSVRKQHGFDTCFFCRDDWVDTQGEREVSTSDRP